MEEVLKLLKEANSAFKVADHLAYVTYPIVNDTKMILTITENLFISVKKAIESLLLYEKLFKRLNNLPEDFRTRFEIFKTFVSKKYNIPRENILLVEDIMEIINHRQKSPIEFLRKDKMIICSRTYTTKTIDLKKVKDYLSQTRSFLANINRILIKNDRIRYR